MIPCPSCGEMLDADAHPALDTLETGAATAESYAKLKTKCPNCGHEFDAATAVPAPLETPPS